jgi:Uncharacterized conserved protein (DUF2203)
MTAHRYAPADADALAPLLRSIGRELVERTALTVELERRLAELRASPFFSDERRGLEAELALQRRELRHCRAELQALGCSVIGTTPLTIRIPTRVGNVRRSRMWQPRRRARS